MAFLISFPPSLTNCTRSLCSVLVLGLTYPAAAQETTVPPATVTAPATVADPAAPLIEPGETLAPVPPPMAKPPEDSNLLLPPQPSLVPSNNEVPLPQNTPQSNAVGTDVGTPMGAPEGGPVSSILQDGTAEAQPQPPPMLNNSKAMQFSLDVQGVYDNNIFFSSKDPVSDYIFVVSPKMTLQRGDFRAKEESFGILNYNPQAIFFAQGKESSTLDQNLKLEIQYAIARLAVGLEASYQRLSGATPDLGNRVDRDQSGAKLRFTYGWGPKLEAETAFLYTGTNYSPAQLSDFSEFVNETLVRYQVSARTKVGLGAAFGRLNVDGYGHQDFQRALVQVISEVGPKVSLRAKGGMEFRQMNTGNANTPIFSLAMDYKIREGTTFTLEAYRDVAASGGQPGDNITRTGVAAKVRQKVSTKFTAGLDAGYEKLAYSEGSRGNNSTTSAQSSGRDDSYFFLRPSVQYELKQGRRFEIYYLHRENDSSNSNTSFEGDQLGVSAGIDF